jgi:hypothetical protein
MRVKGMSLTEVATYYSLMVGITGMIGTFGAGWLVDKLSVKDRRWFGWVPALAFALSIPSGRVCCMRPIGRSRWPSPRRRPC